MSTQPNQENNVNQNGYGGYGGYRPRKSADDPYGVSSQQGSSSGISSTQSTSQSSDPNYTYGQQHQQGQSYASSSSAQQQQKIYEPPSSVTGRKSRSSSSSSLPIGQFFSFVGQFFSSIGRFFSNLKPNQAAFFSYLFICFGGIFFLFYERKNRLVRFSAAQSIVLFLPLLIINGILRFLIGVISPWLWGLGSLLAFPLVAINFLLIAVGVVLWLVLMFQAYQGHELKLPFVGDYAERLLSLFTPRKRTN